MKYLELIKGKADKGVEMKTSNRRDVMKNQKGKCAKCKKDLNPVYSKFVKKADGNYEVICSNCAVSIPKR